ncbi:MAG: sigma-70 family RNA polymerase sigma factor [Clostridia bacterium]|nr:sigma-70 family RNA polymerase sigma factor [Clostridia bacterium]
MNEQLILDMAKPFVKDGRLTYEQFDVIYEMLSRREQYQVVEILFCHDIELFDEEALDDEDILDLDEDESEEQSDDEHPEIDKDAIRAQVDSLFSTSGASSVLPADISAGSIKQSNAILCYLFQQGNMQAAQELCIKNRLLVLKYANAYFNYFGNDLSMDDLEQAGYIGLLRAARDFDIAKNNAFTTYATFWIKQSISREVSDTGYTIRLPVHVLESISKVTRLEAEYDRQGIEYEERIRLITEKLEWSEAKVRHCIELRTRYRDTASLNLLVGEDGSTELGDLLPDMDQPTPEEIVFAQLNSELIERALQQLKKREADVIKLRYGLNGETPHTLEEVGAMYKVTRERIRQIEAKAIRRLQRFKELKAFWED